MPAPARGPGAASPWSYLPGRRRGVSLKQMNEAERKAAHALLAASLSARGAEKAEGVLELEGILRGIERFFGRDPQLYYVIALRRPVGGVRRGRGASKAITSRCTSPPGAERLVSSTPAFFGANPARVPDGPRAGWRLLGAEEDLARELLASLDAAGAPEGDPQRLRAVGHPPRARAARTCPIPRASLTPRCLPRRAPCSNAWSAEYVGNLREEFARAQREKIEKAGWASVRFAWAGGREPGRGALLPGPGPTFLIEYDNTQGGANHVHSVYRDLENDFSETCWASLRGDAARNEF